MLIPTASVTGADRPDAVPGNTQASTALEVRLATILTAASRSGALIPGAAPIEVWRMRFRNPAALPETLTAFRLVDIATGPGTLAQRDSEWTALALTVAPADVPI